MPVLTLFFVKDFNDVIIKHVLAEFKKKEGVDLSEDKIALQRIREASENAKHILSSRETGANTPSASRLHLFLCVNHSEYHLAVSQGGQGW